MHRIQIIRRHKKSIAVLALCMLCGCGSKSPPPDVDAIKADVKKIMAAVSERDSKTLIAYTHPKLVTALGGEHAAVKSMDTELAKLNETKFKFESVEFPSPPRFVESKENDFVLVPTKSIVSVNSQRLESHNFQLGVRAKGEAAWKYVDGNKLAGQALKLLFPDFPADERLPEVAHKVL